MIVALDDQDDTAVEHLLNSGADADARQEIAVDGNPFLVWLNQLLGDDSQSGSFPTALQIAAQSGDVRAVHLLLEHGASVNDCDKFGGAPLASAVAHHNQQIAQCLLDHDADPNQRDDDGIAVLTEAVRDGDYKTAEVLLNHGAEVEDTDVYGTTNLMIACKQGNPALISLLLRHHASLTRSDDHDNTALWYATQHRSKSPIVAIRSWQRAN